MGTDDKITCVCLLRHVRIAESEPYCHSILFVCLSVIPRPTAYHDWSITTKFGRQVYAYTCPRIRVSLFGSPVSHTLGARWKNMLNFAYFQANVTHRAIWLVCLSVCLSVCVSVVTPTVAILGQFRWNFAQSFGAQKLRSSSLGVKIR